MRNARDHQLLRPRGRRGVRSKKHGPTIGILLCAETNDQVVHYSVDRIHSPVTVNRYALKAEELKQLPAELH